MSHRPSPHKDRAIIYSVSLADWQLQQETITKERAIHTMIIWVNMAQETGLIVPNLIINPGWLLYQANSIQGTTGLRGSQVQDHLMITFHLCSQNRGASSILYPFSHGRTTGHQQGKCSSLSSPAALQTMSETFLAIHLAIR